MKKCNKCLVEKEEDCFWRNKSNSSGLNNVCKQCWSEYRVAKWANKQKDFWAEKEKVKQTKKEDLASGHKLCCRCKNKLSLDYFFKDKYTKDGYARSCKKCQGRRTPEEIKQMEKEKLSFLETGIKTCSKCKIEKPLFDFGKSKSSLAGINPRCKSCENIRNIEKRNRNRERIRERQKANRNSDIERHRAKQREQDRKRRKRPEVKISQSFSRRIRKSIGKNKNGCHWEILVGYTMDQLKAHLERQFKPGMSWGNYGLHGWHIDHIRPVSSFDITTYDCEDFRKCWSLENLQPLWAKDNLIKSNKIHLPDMSECIIDDSTLEVL